MQNKTISEFMDECRGAIKARKEMMRESKSQRGVFELAIAAIKDHFYDANIPIKKVKYADDSIGFVIEDRRSVNLSYGQQVVLIIEYWFNLLIEQGSTQEEFRIKDDPIEFRQAKVGYRVPLYGFENGLLVRDSHGLSCYEKAKLESEADENSTSDSIAASVDVTDIERAFAGYLCRPVLDEFYKGNGEVAGIEKFIDRRKCNIDTKSMSNYIYKNMMSQDVKRTLPETAVVARDGAKSVSLPVLIGDTVFAIFDGRVLSYVVENITMSKDKETVFECYAYGEKESDPDVEIVDTDTGENDQKLLDVIDPVESNFGKTVFLTKEEAAKAL